MEGEAFGVIEVVMQSVKWRVDLVDTPAGRNVIVHLHDPDSKLNVVVPFGEDAFRELASAGSGIVTVNGLPSDLPAPGKPIFEQ